MTFKPPDHWIELDAAKTKSWTVKPTEWLIEDIVAAGNLVLVAATTQTGKTLLWMYVCTQLVLGDALFGRFPVKAVDKLLYLCLEDPPRRIRDRMEDYRVQLPKNRMIVKFCPGLQLHDHDHLEWLEQEVVKKKYKVVVVDTWQRATSGAASYDDTLQAPAMHALADLTRRLGVTIIIIDHLRKTGVGKPRKHITIDDIKGTSAKAQNSDAVILMERAGQEIKVHVSSKDTDKQVGFSLCVREQGGTGPKFEYIGTLEAAAVKSSVLGKKNRLRVLQALDATEYRSSSTISKTTGLPPSSVRRHLQDLTKAGQAEAQGEGRWRKYRSKEQAA